MVQRTTQTAVGIGIAAGSCLLAAWAAGDLVTVQATIVRDSAGVTIVEHAGSPWEGPAPWTVAAEPAVRIGVVDGAADYMFNGLAQRGASERWPDRGGDGWQQHGSMV